MHGNHLRHRVLIFAVIMFIIFVLAGCEDATGPSVSNSYLQVQPENPLLINSLSYQFTAVMHQSDGSTTNLTTQCDWQVSPSSLGYFNNSQGIFYTYSSGLGYIYARHNGYCDSTIIQVATLNELIVEPTSIYVAPAHTLELRCLAVVSMPGNWSDTLDFTNSAIWISDNSSIAEVTPYGLLTGKALGNTTLRAGWGSLCENAQAHVANLDYVSLDVDPQIVFSPQDTFQLSAFAHYGSHSQDVSTQCDWQSSDPGVMSFPGTTSPGCLVVQAPGTASIQAIYGSTTSEPVTLTSKELQSITISPTDTTLNSFGTVQYTAIGHYSDYSTFDLTGMVDWSSSNPGIGMISASGVATPVDSGSCVITARKNSLLSNAANLVINVAMWGENFDNGLIHTWEEAGDWFIQNGEYVNQTGYGDNYSYNTDMEFSNFRMEVDFMHCGAYVYYSSGILFRGNSGIDDHYFIVIWPTGDYRIGCVQNGTWDEFDYGMSTAINTGFNVWNHIRVEAVGSSLSFYINDEFISQVTDDALVSGSVGFNGGPESGYEFRYDNLTIAPISVQSRPFSIPTVSTRTPLGNKKEAFTRRLQ
jgi:hypothetical protein